MAMEVMDTGRAAASEMDKAKAAAKVVQDTVMAVRDKEEHRS